MALDERGCTWDGPGLVSSLPTFGPRLFGHHAPRVVNTAGWARSLFRRQFTRNGTLCPLGGLRNPLWAPHSWRLVDFGMPILALRLLPRFHLLVGVDLTYVAASVLRGHRLGHPGVVGWPSRWIGLALRCLHRLHRFGWHQAHRSRWRGLALLPW